MDTIKIGSVVFLFISLLFLPEWSFAQRGNAEIQLHNATGTQQIFDASAQGLLKWESTDGGSTFSVTSSYNDVSSDTVPAGKGGAGFGWDWARDSTLTNNGEMTNSRYRIWIVGTGYQIYIDFRDDRYPYYPFC
jgi:hypothetical protein